MTPAELAAIRARVDAASEGPWSSDTISDRPYLKVWWMRPQGTPTSSPVAMTGDNLDFIAHARADIPALLECIEEQRSVLAKLLLESIIRKNAAHADATVWASLECHIRTSLGWSEEAADAE